MNAAPSNRGCDFSKSSKRGFRNIMRTSFDERFEGRTAITLGNHICKFDVHLLSILGIGLHEEGGELSTSDMAYIYLTKINHIVIEATRNQSAESIDRHRFALYDAVSLPVSAYAESLSRW